jgi:hypothetical protein
MVGGHSVFVNVLVRQVRRLQGLQRVTLAPGQTKTVEFTLNPNNVGVF